jgi:uncharacterized membrane protein YkvA (DUF1232 family)
MSEFVEYVNHGASRVTPRVVELVLRQLPMWKVEFTQINSPKYPHLVDQLEFLADAVEDFAEGVYKDLPYVAFSEAAFALIYAHKKFEVIPDLLPDIGRGDDSSVVRAVLIQNERVFEKYAETQGFNWKKITSKP